MLASISNQISQAVRSLKLTRRRKAAACQGQSVGRVALCESRQLLAGTWTRVNANNPLGGSGTMMLLTDGTLMVQGGGVTAGWSKLTPDSSGNYVNGTWTTLASMSETRLYTANVVMPDGRLFVLGGEYSSAGGWVNTGEIYNPLTNTWTATAPFPQSSFGDGQGVLLPNGKILCGYLSDTRCYLYDPATDTWSQTGSKIHGDRNNEETWLLLPDGSVLSYDIFASPASGPGKAQRYVTSTGQWVDAGVVPVPLSGSSLGYELGGGSVLPDGRVMLIGANNNSVFYHPSTNTWTQGPSMPSGLGSDDAPCALLPDGHLVFFADTPLFNGPTKMFDFDYRTDLLTDITPGGAVGAQLGGPAYVGRMLILPNGHMMMNTGSSVLWEYTPEGVPDPSWAPTITNITQTATLPQPVFTLSGTQLTGISEGAIYGDDAGMSTNYPIVRLRNEAGVVKYARTTGWTPGLGTGALVTSVQFTMPSGFAVDAAYKLSVIANGIASQEVDFGKSFLLKDINSGSPNSNPQNLTNVNGTLVFTANDGSTGVELWKSDGTKNGTVLVKDIVSGINGSSPSNLTNVNGTLFFTADNGKNGIELWKSNGTAAGTVMVKDIFAGKAASTPRYLTNVNGTLYFQATDGKLGAELWKSDGTTAGTVMVKDIRAGVLGSSPTSMTSFNNTLYFTASDGATGVELWKSDGTKNGTVLVKDIWAGASTSSPANLTVLGSTLYFTANSGTTGAELWKTDGTTAGTVLVKDIDTRLNIGSSPKYLTGMNGVLYFQATTLNVGAELWRSDGTAAGTWLVSDVNPGSVGSSPSFLHAFNGALYFQYNDQLTGSEIAKSDGTAAGTAPFLDVNTITLNSSHPTNFVDIGSKMYFVAGDLTSGYELWITDGSVAGTKVFRDLNAGVSNSNPAWLVDVNGKLFFTATNGALGIELFMYDTSVPVPIPPPSRPLAGAPVAGTASRRAARKARRQG
jgi:ELWxxDGT repeat protein